MNSDFEINSNEIENSLENEVFENRELVKPHKRYSVELQFMNLIKDGKYEALKEMLESPSSNDVGRMSRNPLRQQMYEFIAGITLVTRFAIEGGLSEEEAYHLSDIYIQKADSCTAAEDIWKLYSYMILDFTKRVSAAKHNSAASKVIEDISNYIFNHLHYKITLKELAAHACFAETYLSALFKKETGDSITDFIHKKRVDEAKSLLRYSEYTLSEISQYLGFSSQSHFCHIFRRHAGITPTQFRKTYFRRNWNDAK